MTERPNPLDIVKIDKMPPQANLAGEVDWDTNTVRFRPYYSTINLDTYGPWTAPYSMDDIPIQLVWDELWPNGNPVNN